MKAPIAVALDAPSIDVAVEWARAVEPFVSTAKIGLEIFVHYGPKVVNEIKSAAPTLEIFLDLKLHDIPNTVAGAARAVSDLAPEILTVHASGSTEMVRAAVLALPATQIAAVTVLTSMTEQDLQKLQWQQNPLDQALTLARIAVDGGAKALVCSPAEVAAMKAEFGGSVRLITPGVRPVGSAADDQSRVATPQAALQAGADLLVIGRPITSGYQQGGAAAVAQAASDIALSIR